METGLTPFLKWAGGKRWLTNSTTAFAPRVFNRYIEPFLGSGAVFFHLAPENAILSDLNTDLIELYTAMRDEPNSLWDCMNAHQRYHSEDYYYQIRNTVPSSRIDRAARFLYLNRTCWNGLYRVNLRGIFNVPIGSKSNVILDSDDFRASSRMLERVDIRCCDFEQTIDEARDGDYLFVDPPYTVQHNFNGFIKYNEKLFSWADQIRLRDALVRAVDRGASVAVTNANHETLHEAYAGIFQYKRLDRASVLAASSAKRGRVSEALFYAGFSV